MNDTGEVRGGPANLLATWSHLLSKKHQNTSIPPDPSPVDSTIHCLLEVKNNPLMFIVKKLINLDRTWHFNDRSVLKWVLLEMGTEMPVWGSAHAYHVLSFTSVVLVVGVTEVTRFLPSLTSKSPEKAFSTLGRRTSPLTWFSGDQVWTGGSWVSSQACARH